MLISICLNELKKSFAQVLETEVLEAHRGSFLFWHDLRRAMSWSFCWLLVEAAYADRAFGNRKIALSMRHAPALSRVAPRLFLEDFTNFPGIGHPGENGTRNNATFSRPIAEGPT